MKLAEKIERVFSSRRKPVQVRIADEVLRHDPTMEFLRHDPDVKDALWFSGRERHELTLQHWREHSSAIYFFDPEAFAYYLPSVLLLSAQNLDEWLEAADSLINALDCSPDPQWWTEGLVRRFQELNPAELDVLKEWLLHICESDTYKRWGIAASGPGDTFGRAFDTVELLQKEVERRYLERGND